MSNGITPPPSDVDPHLLRNSQLIDLCANSFGYDNQVKAACGAFDTQMYQIIDATPVVIFISQILQLADSNLVDILAWQFHVDFYDHTKPLDFRKNLVFNSIQWHMRKGTVDLLQEVLDTFWPGGATINEWFSYDDPLPPNFPIDDADEWRVDFDATDVNVPNDRFQIRNAQLAENEGIFFVLGATGNTLPAPLVAGTTYYVRNYNQNNFQVSAALGGTPINLTNTGTGANQIWHKAAGTGSWHDRYRFRVDIDETIITPDDEAQVSALINAYKPVSRWNEGFVRSTVSTGTIGWMGGMLRFVDRTSEAPVQGSNLTLGVGLFYMVPSYRDSKHQPNYADTVANPGITNPNVAGVLVRETTALIQPVSESAYDWSFLDTSIGVVEAANKLWSLQNLAGQYAPPWFFTAHPEETLVVTNVGNTTVPFGPAFREWYLNHQIATAAKYKSHFRLKYVCMSGVGNASESFLVKTIPKPPPPVPPDFDPLADEKAANALAIALGWTDTFGFGGTNGVLRSAWITSVLGMVDDMVSVWSPIPVVLVTGPPYPTNGVDDLIYVYNTAFAKYGKLFGWRSDGLTAGVPSPTDPVSVPALTFAPTCPGVGCQSHNYQNGIATPPPPTSLDNQLNRACMLLDCNFVEVWQQDVDDAVSAPIIQKWNNFLITKTKSVFAT